MAITEVLRIRKCGDRDPGEGRASAACRRGVTGTARAMTSQRCCPLFDGGGEPQHCSKRSALRTGVPARTCDADLPNDILLGNGPCLGDGLDGVNESMAIHFNTAWQDTTAYVRPVTRVILSFSSAVNTPTQNATLATAAAVKK